MAKPPTKRNQKEENQERKKEEEEEEENPLNPSPSEVGLGDEDQFQKTDEAELNEEMKDVQRQEEKVLHPVLGMVFESNVTKYRGRKTEFLTLPMNLTKQPGYPFKGSVKQKVRITLTEDGSRLIVEKLI